MLFRLTPLLALLATAPALPAQPAGAVPPAQSSENVSVRLIPETASVRPGQTLRVALAMDMEGEWHTYWKNPGDAGTKTSIAWTLPAGWEAGKLAQPTPEKFEFQGIVSYGYHDRVVHLTRLEVPADAEPGTTARLKARVSWLECADICLPGEATFTLSLPVVSRDAEAAPVEAFAEPDQWYSRHEPVPLGQTGASVRAWQTAEGYRLRIQPGPGMNADPGSLYFFNGQHQPATMSSPVSTNAPQQVSRTGDGAYVIDLQPSEFYEGQPARLAGIVRAAQGWFSGRPHKGLAIDTALTPPPDGAAAQAPGTGAAGSAPTAGSGAPGGADTPPAGGGFAAVLAAAFLGGLILNLMPCVFPVLGLKIMGFVNQAGAERGKIIAHGLVFAAGVLLSFWALAAIIIALDLGEWGTQLQSPLMTYTVILVFFIFGLNLAGVFEVGQSLVGAGSGLQRKGGLTGTFFTGLLAVVVGTPCAAPLMAGAVGTAITQGGGTQIFLTLTAMGLGLAAPYLVLSAFPSLVQKLPRPGTWMETFKQTLAFVFFATAAYFTWTLAGQVGQYIESALRDILVGLAVIAFAFWLYGRYGGRATPLPKRVGLLALAGLLLAGTLALSYAHILEERERRQIIAQQEETGTSTAARDFLVWQQWTPEKQATLREQGRIVYVDFTARWCVTCQVNNRAYEDPAVKEAFLENNVALLKADWTNRNPAITRELNSFGRAAVPFNVIYAPGREEPIIMPELFGADTVLSKLATALADAPGNGEQLAAH